METRKRVLVVDDDPKNRLVLKAYLETFGHTPEMAADGPEALEKLDSTIDLVLLDVMMPGIDGYEVARRIRAHPESSDIPIIMVTVLSTKEDRLRAVEAGANDFIAKPIDRLELKVRLSSLLRMKEGQDAIKRYNAELEDAVTRRTAELRESEKSYRRLYEESKRREELYHSVLNSSADAITINDMVGRAKYVNPAFERVFGWTMQEIEGKKIPYVPDSEREATVSLMEDLLARGEPCSGFESRRYTRHGNLVEVSLSASRYHDHQGSPLGSLVILRDITGRKRIEEALRESEHRFRTLFETAQDCIFLKDKEFRYTDANRATVEMLELPRTGIIGKTDDQLFSKDCADHCRKLESRVLLGQTIESQQTVHYKGRLIGLDFIRFPLRDSSGEITGICGIVRDITERVRLSGGTPDTPDEYTSAAMRRALAAARLAAETDSIIILTGESGAGKDHLARYIHDHSPRAVGPFFSVNCAALPHELAESELFGHEAGAFTGAGRRKRGLVELAEGGTLLLNEIGELSFSLQAKLLTFLDTFTITRVGGEKSVTVNARLIAATNRDLEKEIAGGRFRKDLFYRLNVFSIEVPPLRERADDIPRLVHQLLARIASDMHLSAVPGIEPRAIARLCRYPWPGNVRELRNALERALILSRGGTVSVKHLGIEPLEEEQPQVTAPASHGQTLDEILGAMERALIEDALRRCGGSKREAARQLGISRFALKRHMGKLGICER